MHIHINIHVHIHIHIHIIVCIPLARCPLACLDAILAATSSRILRALCRSSCQRRDTLKPLHACIYVYMSIYIYIYTYCKVLHHTHYIVTLCYIICYYTILYDISSYLSILYRWQGACVRYNDNNNNNNNIVIVVIVIIFVSQILPTGCAWALGAGATPAVTRSPESPGPSFPLRDNIIQDDHPKTHDSDGNNDP